MTTEQAAEAWRQWHAKEQPPTHDHFLGIVWRAFEAGFAAGTEAPKTHPGGCGPVFKDGVRVEEGCACGCCGDDQCGLFGCPHEEPH